MKHTGLVRTFIVLVVLLMVVAACSPAATPQPTTAPVAPADTEVSTAPEATTAPEVVAAPTTEEVTGDTTGSEIEVPDIYQWPADEAVDWVDTTQYKKDPPYTIGLSNCSTNNAWASLYIETAKWEAQKHSEIKDLIITDANNDPSKQLSDIEDLIAQNVDAIIVRPCTADAGVPAIKSAMQSGIPVFISNRGTSTTSYVSEQATNMKDIGKNQGTWLAAQLNDAGNIVSIEGTAGSAPQAERYEGAMDVLSQYPDIKVLARQSTDWNRAQAKTAMENFIQAYPNINGVLAQSGAISMGVVEALDEAGEAACSIPVTGDDYNGFMKWVKTNQCGMITTNPTWCSGASIMAALMTLNGQQVPKNWYIPTVTYDASTIDQVVAMDKPDEWYPNILPSDWDMSQ